MGKLDRNLNTSSTSSRSTYLQHPELHADVNIGGGRAPQRADISSLILTISQRLFMRDLNIYLAFL